MDSKVTKTLVFKFEKETKNAVRFQETSEIPMIGPLYVQKHALATLGNVKTQEVRVTIELP